MSSALQILSRRNWGLVRYNAVFHNLAALLYLGLVYQIDSPGFFLLALRFAVLSTCLTAYGYFVNDLADTGLDQRHHKPNPFLNLSRPVAALVVGFFLLAGLALALPFQNTPGFAPILLLWVFLSSAYSLRPLRLKERGGLGLAASVLSQQTLPVMLLFLAFAPAWDWGALIFVGFASLRGLCSDVSHQLRDYPDDRQTHTRTYVVERGENHGAAVYAISLEASALFTGVVLGWLIGSIPAARLGRLHLPFSPIWPVMLLYLLLLGRTVGRAWRAYRQGTLPQVDPYNESRQTSARNGLHWMHHSLPGVILPLWLACIAGVYYPRYLLFVILLVGLHRLYAPDLWRKILPYPN
jgi:4-hydroxybenzoate polyprenyltransferase